MTLTFYLIYFSCLSQGLTQILAGLMEVDPSQSMTFDLFFQSADDILDREVVHVFSTTSARHFRLYMDKNCKYVTVVLEFSASSCLTRAMVKWRQGPEVIKKTIHAQLS